MGRTITIRAPGNNHGAALTRSLPQELRRVLASGLVPDIVDEAKGGGIKLRERLDWEPQTPEPHIARIAGDAREALLEHLTPIDPELLGPAVAKLLAHRWRQRAEPISDLMQEALILDWLEDLGDYPAWAFHAAAREWRRTQPWCPTIADIRALCEAEVEDDRRTLRLIGRLLDAVPRGTAETRTPLIQEGQRRLASEPLTVAGRPA